MVPRLALVTAMLSVCLVSGIMLVIGHESGGRERTGRRWSRRIKKRKRKMGEKGDKSGNDIWRGMRVTVWE